MAIDPQDFIASVTDSADQIDEANKYMLFLAGAVWATGDIEKASVVEAVTQLMRLNSNNSEASNHIDIAGAALLDIVEDLRPNLSQPAMDITPQDFIASVTDSADQIDEANKYMLFLAGAVWATGDIEKANVIEAAIQLMTLYPDDAEAPIHINLAGKALLDVIEDLRPNLPQPAHASMG